MAVENISINGDVKNVTTCLDLPSNEDWIPDVVMLDGNTVIKPLSFVLLNVEDPAVIEGSHRCYQFAFPADKAPLSASFVVRKITTSLPESLSQNECDTAMVKIQTTRSDLNVSCKVGDHGVAFNYEKLPANLNEQQFSELIRNVLTKTVEGPWQMSLSQ